MSYSKTVNCKEKVVVESLPENFRINESDKITGFIVEFNSNGKPVVEFKYDSLVSDVPIEEEVGGFLLKGFMGDDRIHSITLNDFATEPVNVSKYLAEVKRTISDFYDLKVSDEFLFNLCNHEYIHAALYAYNYILTYILVLEAPEELSSQTQDK